MTRRLAPLTAALLVAAPLAAQSAPSVTLFNNGRTLVRRSLPVAVARGSSTHTLAIGLFDPSTLTALDQGVQITRVAYDGASDETSLLRRNIGHEFSFNVGDGKMVRARLVAMDPERWEILDSDANLVPGVIFSRPGRLSWPPELVPLAPVTDVTVSSDRARDALRVMYETNGGSWNAGYRLFLGAHGRLEGTATIAAGTLDLADADVQLLAGDIGQRINAAPMPMAAMARSDAMKVQEMSAGPAESIGEVKLYTLPGKVTFTPGTMLALPLFDPAPVSPELKLSVGGSLPYYGGFGQQPDEQEVPVEVSYRIERKQGTAFGDLPLPAGGVSVYDTDQGGRVQLVGQGGIGHTAPGERFEVSTGTAFDVTARRTQTEFTTTRQANPSRTIANVGYSVTLTNAKDTAVTVEVREDRAGEWSVVASSVAPVKRSSSRVVFPVVVPARGEATLTYRLRVVW